MAFYSVRKIWMYFLAILKYIFFQIQLCDSYTYTPPYFSANKWSRDSRFALVIVGSIKYTCETVLCGKILYKSWPKPFVNCLLLFSFNHNRIHESNGASFVAKITLIPLIQLRNHPVEITLFLEHTRLISPDWWRCTAECWSLNWRHIQSLKLLF